MENLDIWTVLLKQGPLFVVGGLIVWWLVQNRKEMKLEYTALIEQRNTQITTLNTELKDYAKDYKDLANKSLSVLILVDDKLKADNHSGETIKEVHRIVQEILDIEKRRA